MDIFDRIKTEIDEKGLSVKAVEKELGFSNGSLSKLKTGTKNLQRIVALAEYLNVSSDYILGLTDERDFNSMFFGGDALRGYFNSIGWKSEYVDMSKGKPCDVCMDHYLNAPPTEDEPFGSGEKMCEHCARDDNHYTFSNGTISFNVSTQEYGELEKAVYDVCNKWIRDMIYKSIN